MTEIPSPSELIPCVLQEFGLSALGSIELLESGSPNASFRVSSGNLHYCLRCCQRDSRLERQLCLIELQQTLEELGLAVPHIYTTPDGAVAVQKAGLLWQLSEFIEGTGYDYQNPYHSEAAAIWLGRLHLCSSAIRLKRYCAYDLPLEAWWENDDALLDTAYQALAPYVDDLSGWKTVRNQFAAFVKMATQHVPWSVYQALPKVWTHGDFHGLNLKYRDDRLIATFDFEMADVRPRVYDVAFALLMLARQQRGSYILRPDVITRFLHTYEATAAPLSSSERSAIPTMMLLSQLPDPGYLAALSMHKGKDELDKALHYWLKVLAAIEMQWYLLLDSFRPIGSSI